MSSVWNETTVSPRCDSSRAFGGRKRATTLIAELRSISIAGVVGVPIPHDDQITRLYPDFWACGRVRSGNYNQRGWELFPFTRAAPSDAQPGAQEWITRIEDQNERSWKVVPSVGMVDDGAILTEFSERVWWPTYF